MSIKLPRGEYMDTNVHKPDAETVEPVVAPVGAPQLPVKKSKKGLAVGLVSAGVVLLALVGGGLAYGLVYNNPDNVVADALTKVLTAKSGSANGNITVSEGSIKNTIDFSAVSNEAGHGSGDITLISSGSGKDIKVKAHVAGTKDESLVKIDDLKSVLNDALGDSAAASIDQYTGGLVAKIDSKWISIKTSDLDSMTSSSSGKESQCMQSEIQKLRTDTALRDEVVAVYKKNPLFKVTSKGSDANGNRYNLEPIEANGKAFAKALVETKLFKALDDCTSQDLKKALEDSEGSSSSDTTGTLDIWVDGWSHNLNKVLLTTKGRTSNMTLDMSMKLNTNPTVTLPKADTNFSDLKKEIEKIQQQLVPTSTQTDLTSSKKYDYVY